MCPSGTFEIKVVGRDFDLERRQTVVPSPYVVVRDMRLAFDFGVK